MARSIIVEPGQCMEDIAMQEYGSINAVQWLLVDNEGVFLDGFSMDLVAGTELVLRDEPFDKAVYQATRKAGIIPATNSEVESVPIPGADYNDDYNDDHLIEN